MTKFYALALTLLLTGVAKAQQSFDLNDLLDFTGYSISKFDGHIAKKSWLRDYESPRETRTNYNYIQVKKKRKSEDTEVIHRLSFIERPGAPVIEYQTSSLEEFDNLRHDLKKQGFITYTPSNDLSVPVLYQHENTVVGTSLEIQDSTTFYTVRVEKQVLPRLREIQYAEDLLALKSHEYLLATFGPQNVSRDVFHYTESDTNHCSVLFPNTPREVIFIWEDEANYRDISFLIIGGNMLTNGTARNANMITSNEWQSKQGVYAGMKLEELQALNQGKVSFHGFGSEKPGMLTKTSGGKLDFDHLGIVLSCLNCANSNTAAERQSVVDSESAMQEDRKVYVSSIIIIPEKEKKQVTASR
ncbi:hypothetical protein EPD60_15620 [Flaviaesturariibacter flavus]|uniref:Uncharacterized protein n=1 Tax=Flaviaesturariibacter flavus TaxID=2502780 RepID=A0A4V2NV39_9BACT|nr:hypothetical protein [Flaviaesturariibacter flavus]TCJ11986.1 hypothetical protein EPD60_15620 [Flaviaesturariibacter flavus]